MRSNRTAGSAHGRNAVATGEVCDQPVADKVMGLRGGLRRGPWGYLYAPPTPVPGRVQGAADGTHRVGAC